jgi:hypothetical protein
MKHFILFLGCLLNVFIVCGQSSNKGYEEGYVILSNGDTIEGAIKYKSGEEIKDKLTLKVTEEDKRTYKAADLSGFMAGEAQFISAKIDDTNLFLKKLSEGKISLYELQIPSSQRNSDVFKYVMYIIKEKQKEYIELKASNWKKTVAEMITDNDDITQQIEKGKVKLDELPAVIQLYNETEE